MPFIRISVHWYSEINMWKIQLLKSFKNAVSVKGQIKNNFKKLDNKKYK